MSRLLLALLFFPAVAWGAEQTVWQIGKPDHDYAEFAFAGNYQAYAAKFGASRWSSRSAAAIRPGTGRSSSPARSTPGRRRGKAVDDPLHAAGGARGVLHVRIDFADVHGMSRRGTWWRSAAARAFPLAAGGGDESLTNPRAANPSRST